MTRLCLALSILILVAGCLPWFAGAPVPPGLLPVSRAPMPVVGVERLAFTHDGLRTEYYQLKIDNAASAVVVPTSPLEGVPGDLVFAMPVLADGVHTLTLSACGKTNCVSAPDLVLRVGPIPTTVAPTGLRASCAATGKTVTLQWAGKPGEYGFYLGVDDKRNNANAAAVDAWFVAGTTDRSVPKLTAVSRTFAVLPGRPYEWWVGTNTLTAGVGPWTSGLAFTCKGG